MTKHVNKFKFKWAFNSSFNTYSKCPFKERAKWGSSLEFILTVIGYAVGLGNVWRFPFLVFKNGGAAFLIPFFLMLFLVGIPIFFLEIAIGQFSALSPIHLFENMVPILSGLGYAAILVNCFIGFYYNVVISYCFYYFFYSFRSELPWKECGSEPDCFLRKNFSQTCAEEKEEYYLKNITSFRSPSEVYFYDKVLELTNGIENLNGINIKLAVALFVSWVLVFAALSKGVKSLGKISYFTATFPYVMLTILVIKGALLEGADKGLEFYVGKFEYSKLLDPELWKDATVQVFYALSTCSGGIITMASFSDFNNNLIRDSFLVPILDCLTGFYAGFAIFSVLGYMYITKCVSSFAEVAAQGPELAFVVYPEGLSLMGAAAPVFSVLFFIMMLALGFGSEFSIMESCISTVIDVLHKYINTKRKVFVTRAIIILMFFLFGLTMVTRGGLFVLNLIDSSTAGYPLLIIGFLQIVAVPWIYGTDQLIEDIECMVGPKPKWFWKIWVVLWKIICPLVLLAIMVATLIMPSGELSLRGIKYPFYAKVIGWIIAWLPTFIIIVFAIYKCFSYEFDWVDKKTYNALLSPTDDYYKNSMKHLSQHKNKNYPSSSSIINGFENKSFSEDPNDVKRVNSIKLEQIVSF